MKKLLLFFNNPILGGLLSLVGLIDILFKIDSSYFTYQISVGLIILILGVSILFSWAYKQIRIYYYIKKYTTGSFGDSHLYKWQWVKTPHYFNVYIHCNEYVNVSYSNSYLINRCSFPLKSRYFYTGLFSKPLNESVVRQDQENIQSLLKEQLNEVINSITKNKNTN